MEKQATFAQWLLIEVTAARCALLRLYEELDRLRMVEKPSLEREYMEQVGRQEQEIIQLEIECELLEEKERLVQAAINRREPVDENLLEEQIDQLRQEKLEEAIGAEDEWNSVEDVGADQDALQKLYRQIVQGYHPQMHPDQPEAHTMLYQKAQEAYRRRDLDALQLIWEMLTSTEGAGADIELAMEISIREITPEEQLAELAIDYTLVKRIYDSFVPSDVEQSAREELERCRRETERIMEQIKTMKQDFPFTAAEMLSDPAQVDTYKKELEYRRMEAEQKIKRMTERIRAKIEEAKRYA